MYLCETVAPPSSSPPQPNGSPRHHRPVGPATIEGSASCRRLNAAQVVCAFDEAAPELPESEGGPGITRLKFGEKVKLEGLGARPTVHYLVVDGHPVQMLRGQPYGPLRCRPTPSRR